MNSKDFIHALRKVIREEVQTAVRTELSNILNEGKSTKPIAAKPVAVNPTTQSYIKSVKKQYVKNPLLNDILNETTGHSNSGPAVSLEESINYNDFEEWPTMNRSVRPGMGVKSVVPTTDIDGRPVNVNNLPEDVVSALTKDYSALMKAIDKKKGK